MLLIRFETSRSMKIGWDSTAASKPVASKRLEFSEMNYYIFFFWQTKLLRLANGAWKATVTKSWRMHLRFSRHRCHVSDAKKWEIADHWIRRDLGQWMRRGRGSGRRRWGQVHNERGHAAPINRAREEAFNKTSFNRNGISRPNTRKYQPRAASAASLVHLAEQQNKYIRFCFPKWK